MPKNSGERSTILSALLDCAEAMLMNCTQKIEAAYNNTQTYTKCVCQKDVGDADAL
jgi:hypothetical protein